MIMFAFFTQPLIGGLYDLVGGDFFNEGGHRAMRMDNPGEFEILEPTPNPSREGRAKLEEKYVLWKCPPLRPK